jgi:hypothetical protein
MADIENKIKTKVELDSTQAQIEINKLNSIASDGTKELTERIEAKNKQVKLQEQLSKKQISQLESEIKSLKGIEGQEKKVLQLEKKLDSARVKAAKTSDNNVKAQNKLNDSLQKAGESTDIMSIASDKLGFSLTALAANPVVLVLTALVGVFKLLKGAVDRSGKASETFSKIGAKVSAVFNGVLAVLEPVVVFIGENLLAALENPKQAFIDLGNLIKEQLINRIKAFLVIGEAFSLLMEGEFSKAAKKATDGFIQLGTGVENATDKIEEFAEKSKKAYDEAADATERLANKERELAKNRIAIEKQQLKSLRLAEEERQIRDDVSRSIDERIEANRRLGKILEDQSKRELALAQQALSLAQQEIKATGDTIDNIEAVGDAELKVLEIRERITGQRSEQLVNEQSLLIEKSEFERQAQADIIRAEEAALAERKLNKEVDFEAEKQLIESKREYELSALRLTEEGKAAINAEFDLKQQELEEQKKAREQEEFLVNQEALNERDAIELERRRMNGEETLAFELEMLEKKRQQDVSVAGLTAQEIQNINEKANIAKEKLNKASEAAEKAKDKAILDSAIGMAGEAFGISQELAVARAIMNAPEAISNVWSQAGKQPTLPQVALHGSVGTAMVVAPIIKGLANIKKARFPKAKKSGASSQGISSSASGGGAGASVAESAVSNLAANNAARIGVDPSIGANAESSAANRISGSSASNIIFSESAYSDFRNQVNFREERSTV